jgi:hypothetical protein
MQAGGGGGGRAGGSGALAFLLGVGRFGNSCLRRPPTRETRRPPRAARRGRAPSPRRRQARRPGAFAPSPKRSTKEAAEVVRRTVRRVLDLHVGTTSGAAVRMRSLALPRWRPIGWGGTQRCVLGRLVDKAASNSSPHIGYAQLAERSSCKPHGQGDDSTAGGARGGGSGRWR